MSKSKFKRAGRPGLYDETYHNEQIYKLCLLGAKDTEIAELFGISESCLNEWKIKYPKFMESIKSGKEFADAHVASRLYERATGYEHDEDKIFCSDGKIVSERTRKHYPPDTAAAFIWLKNRRGWKDTPFVDQSTHITNITSIHAQLEQYKSNDTDSIIAGRQFIVN